MTRTVTHCPQPRRCEWLRIERSSPTGVAVVAVGGVADERAEELWDLVEHALETADGDAVTVDLTAVTGCRPALILRMLPSLVLRMPRM